MASPAIQAEPPQPDASYPDDLPPAYTHQPPPQAWAENSPPQPQQQEQTIVVSCTGEPSAQASVPTSVADSAFCCQTFLSCFAFWFCGMLFGLIAYIFAVVADTVKPRDRKAARCCGCASITVSIIGIIAGAIVIAVVLGVTLSCKGYWRNGQCYAYRVPMSSDQCQRSYGESSYYDGFYCYSSSCLYMANGFCWSFQSSIYPSSSSCSAAFYGTTFYDGTYCYSIAAPSSSTCRNYYANNQCYNSLWYGYQYSRSCSGYSYFSDGNNNCYYNDYATTTTTAAPSPYCSAYRCPYASPSCNRYGYTCSRGYYATSAGCFTTQTYSASSASCRSTYGTYGRATCYDGTYYCYHN